MLKGYAGAIIDGRDIDTFIDEGIDEWASKAARSEVQARVPTSRLKYSTNWGTGVDKSLATWNL